MNNNNNHGKGFNKPHQGQKSNDQSKKHGSSQSGQSGQSKQGQSSWGNSSKQSKHMRDEDEEDASSSHKIKKSGCC